MRGWLDCRLQATPRTPDGGEREDRCGSRLDGPGSKAQFPWISSSLFSQRGAATILSISRARPDRCRRCGTKHYADIGTRALSSRP